LQRQPAAAMLAITTRTRRLKAKDAVNLITGGGSILKGNFMDADKNILVKLDTNIADYQTFFEPQWLRLMNELTDGTKLAGPVLSLGVLRL
jgi:hypothetical protein